MSDRSLPELAKQTADDVGRLIRLEVRMALDGVKRQFTRAGVSVALGAAGGVLLALGLLLMLAGAALALALVLPTWASFLIVGGGLVLIGGGLAGAAVVGIRSTSIPLPPETREQLTEDARWLLQRSP